MVIDEATLRAATLSIICQAEDANLYFRALDFFQIDLRNRITEYITCVVPLKRMQI
jgi:hypothetical protein